MGDLKYGEHEFPSDRGFTGSAGKSQVKGYMRGGKVKAPRKAPTTARDMISANPPKKARGTASDNATGKSNRAKAKAKPVTPAAQGGSVHAQLMSEGGRMGYKQGGQVKDTSGEFIQTGGPQDPMDPGTVPANKGRNQAEREAGGTGRLKQGYKKGGRAKSEDAATSGAQHAAKREAERRGRKSKKTKATKKAKGGRVEFSESVKERLKDKETRESLGTGAARRAAERMHSRQKRTQRSADKALEHARRAMGVKDDKPKTKS